MTGIHTYSTTASENVQANTGINWDEGMAPSAVNNSARQNMADIRGRWNDAAWFQYGIGSKAVTATYVGTTQFTVTGADATAAWHQGRRVKAVGSTTGTIYGTISAVAYNSGTTVNTITVVWDSGSLSNETLSVYLSAPSPVTGSPISPDSVSMIEGTLASATTTDLGSIGNQRINVTGTTTITGFGTGANKKRLVRFSGALTLTHNASSLILLGGASRTTAAGDIGEYVSDGSGNWRETSYQRAASDPGDRATKTGTETFTNKTFTDSTTAFADDGDATKLLKFQCSGITTGTTRTLTVPDASTTLVGTDATQTLSNKTLSSPTVSGTLTTPDSSTWSSTGIALAAAVNCLKGSTFGGAQSAIVAFAGASTATAYASYQASTASRTHITFENGNGLVGSVTTAASATAFNTSSDYRLKTDEVPLDGKSAIMGLKPYVFTWKAGGSRDAGMFAHEVQACIPSAVQGDKDAMQDIGELINADGSIAHPSTAKPLPEEMLEGQTWEKTGSRPVYQQVDYSKIVPYLVAHCQDLERRLAALGG